MHHTVVPALRTENFKSRMVDVTQHFVTFWHCKSKPSTFNDSFLLGRSVKMLDKQVTEGNAGAVRTTSERACRTRRLYQRWHVCIKTYSINWSG